MRQIKNRIGFSLIEVVVATGVLGLVAMGVTNFSLNMTKSTKTEVDRSSVFQAFTTIQNDIIKDDIYIPAFSPTDANAPTSFSSSRGVVQRCYNQSAAVLPGVAYDSQECFFKVKFYKIGVLDRTFNKTDPLARIPLSRYRIQLSYYVGNDKPTLKTVVLSRLVTGVFVR